MTAPSPQVMQAFEWLQLLGLGGLAGALGQGARTIVGLKKTYDAASTSNVSTSDLFVAHRLIVSLAIGFVAGALAAIGIIDNLRSVSAQQIFALAAAGYAGADFIEGLISRVRGTASAEAGQEVLGTGTPSSASPATDDAVG